MEDIYICKHCGRECKNPNSLRNHERLCKLNPERDIHSLKMMELNRNRWNSGHTAWNKGLTKDSDERILKASKILSEKFSGENGTFYGHKHSETTKKKISESQKRNYEGISVFSTAREHRQSYAEDYFDGIFQTAKKQFVVSRFRLDYAWPDRKEYIEVDGEQHYTSEGIKHDAERTSILESLGWYCKKRIRWSEYQRLSKEEKENFIKSIVM